MITALVAAFDPKAFNNTELLKSYLGGGNRIIKQSNRKRHGEIFDKPHSLRLL